MPWGNCRSTPLSGFKPQKVSTSMQFTALSRTACSRPRNVTSGSSCRDAARTHLATNSNWNPAPEPGVGERRNPSLNRARKGNARRPLSTAATTASDAFTPVRSIHLMYADLEFGCSGCKEKCGASSARTLRTRSATVSGVMDFVSKVFGVDGTDATNPRRARHTSSTRIRPSKVVLGPRHERRITDGQQARLRTRSSLVDFRPQSAPTRTEIVHHVPHR